MTWRTVLTVFRKEARDSLRDRRSLAAALLYSFLGPLLVAVALAAPARSPDDDAPAVAAAEPAAVEQADPATAESRAGRALTILPVYLLLAAFVGGMSVAIDTTAGERERLSLEALLIHPVPRQALAWGKFLAAALVNFGVVVLTLAAALGVLGLERLDGPPELGVRKVGAILVLLLPLALFGPAVEMLAALFARSYKEAQTYLSLLIMVPMLPGMLLAFGSFEVAPWMRWAPVLGHQIMITDLLAGGDAGVASSVGLGAATLLAAAAAVVTTGRLLQHERVVLAR